MKVMSYLDQYHQEKRLIIQQVRDEWTQKLCGGTDPQSCNGRVDLAYALLSGDISTDMLRAQAEKEAKDYLTSKGVSYACQYGSVACAGAIAAGAVLNGQLSPESAAKAALVAGASAAGTTIGCTMGPLGCIAGNVVGGIVGNTIANSPVGDAVGSVAGAIADGASEVIGAIKSLF